MLYEVYILNYYDVELFHDILYHFVISLCGVFTNIYIFFLMNVWLLKIC